MKNTSRPKRMFAALLASMFVTCLAQSSQAQGSGSNLLALGEGALPVASAEPSSARWGTINLLDDAPSSGWCSQKGHVTNSVFVFELPEPATLTSYEFDTAGVDGAGRGAKDITVEVSAAATGPFRKMLEASLQDRKDGQRFAATGAVSGRFVRLTILNNHGDAEWTELMSFRGFGERPPSRPALAISGTFHSSWNDFHLRQEGGALIGCYEHEKGVFNGTIEGRVAKLSWDQSAGNNRRGPAVFVFSPDGKSFRGYWWYDTDKARAVDGDWTGDKNSDQVGSCTHWSGSVAGQLRSELSASNRARLYGVLFDVDSAHLRNESLRTLDEVVRLLTTEPSWKITVEGHTDSTGTADHNQVLSANRAKAVRDYLVSKGISEARLASAGFGQSKPVADNATELGRAQNRRVELVRK